jgi:TPR repeat protein
MKLTFKHAVAAIILVLAFGAPVAAGPLEDATAASDRGDHATAVPLFRALAIQGNVQAQSALGYRYFHSIGVPQDYAEAAKWYHRPAIQGHLLAQYNLGVMYARGWGVHRDYHEAAKWYRLAADNGSSAAQYDLGKLYEEGHGVPQDYALAYKWFNLAAAQNNQDAEKYRDSIAQRMTPAQIAEAQKLAREWKPTRQPPE